MYGQTAQTSARGREVSRSGGQTGQRARKKTADRQERVRLLQLLVCMLLFLAVFIGKGVFPSGLQRVGEDILALITADTDFRAAFSRLGGALTGGSDLGEGLEEFCIEVFGGEAVPEKAGASNTTPVVTSLLTTERQFLSQTPDRTVLTQHYLDTGTGHTPSIPIDQIPAIEESTPAEVTEPETVAATGVVLLKSDYNGQALPNNYTMDQLSLGGLEIVTPVLGYITSGYGYREHPVNGKYLFHGGVDIGGNSGDPIQAFASGKVEYVGKDDSYGLYLQLDHGNGIKSFYAHCKSICVTKGQTVALGEKIGEVGSTGTATGPHLHLELKYERMHIDPAYYIQSLSSQ